ncbi:MAG TPA: alpha/beta hydrolase [Pseudonocardiaceae bacterium]
MPVATANGIELYYELAGQGAAVVLIGGLGTDSTFLRPVTRNLAERFSVLSFDNRGAGRSDKPDIPYSIEMMATDAIELMDAVGVERAHVVGISMGASVALAMALGYGERVTSLVLVSASAKKSMDMTISKPFRLIRLLGRALPPIAEGKYPQPDYAFERQRAASRTYDCSVRLGEIAAPTLIMHGRKDRTVPLELAEQLQAGIPRSTLMTFAGGHAFFLFGERDRFLRETGEFCTAHNEGGG